MAKIIKIIGIVGIAFIVLLLFYWSQIRPEEIRKKCEIEATNKGTKSPIAINNFFRQCLVKNGMSPESIFVNLK